MKLQIITPIEQAKTLVEIKKVLLQFKNTKLESKYITELKEIKQVHTELVWDYDQ
jgi:hypothetical protein